MNTLLNRTITQAPLSQISVGDAFQLVFRPKGPEPKEIRLSTRVGDVLVFLGQTCRVEPQSGREDPFRLKTVSYRYHIRPDGKIRSAFRWEYTREAPGDHCHHHFQGPLDADFGRAFSLDDIHLPTGYVTIEEIVRFLIVDLGVKPLTATWREVIADSYRTFKTKLAPRGPDST